MSYVTVSKGKLGSISLPSNPCGHAGSMRIKATKQHPLSVSHHRLFALAMVTLLAVAFGFNPAARAQDVSASSSSQGRFNQSGITQHRRVTQWKQSDC
jgi:hypothetical protein